MRRMRMMEQLFNQILAMSLTGSIVIAAVMILRLLLKRAPRLFSYCLWAAVWFRLLCPDSFTAGFSLFSILDIPSVSYETTAYLPAGSADTPKGRHLALCFPAKRAVFPDIVHSQ